MNRQIYYFRGNAENGTMLRDKLVELTSASYDSRMTPEDCETLYYNIPTDVNHITELDSCHEDLLKATGAKEIKFTGNERWRAMPGEKYWSIDLVSVVEFVDTRSDFDATVWKKGNYFQSKEEAEKAWEKLKPVWVDIVQEHSKPSFIICD